MATFDQWVARGNSGSIDIPDAGVIGSEIKSDMHSRLPEWATYNITNGAINICIDIVDGKLIDLASNTLHAIDQNFLAFATGENLDRKAGIQNGVQRLHLESDNDYRFRTYRIISGRPSEFRGTLTSLESTAYNAGAGQVSDVSLKSSDNGTTVTIYLMSNENPPPSGFIYGTASAALTSKVQSALDLEEPFQSTYTAVTATGSAYSVALTGGYRTDIPGNTEAAVEAAVRERAYEYINQQHKIGFGVYEEGFLSALVDGPGPRCEYGSLTSWTDRSPADGTFWWCPNDATNVTISLTEITA